MKTAIVKSVPINEGLQHFVDKPVTIVNEQNTPKGILCTVETVDGNRCELLIDRLRDIEEKTTLTQTVKTFSGDDTGTQEATYYPAQDWLNILHDGAEISLKRHNWEELTQLVKRVIPTEFSQSASNQDMQTAPVFSRNEIEKLQTAVFQITGEGEVMKLFNGLLGIGAGS